MNDFEVFWLISLVMLETVALAGAILGFAFKARRLEAAYRRVRELADAIRAHRNLGGRGPHRGRDRALWRALDGIEGTPADLKVKAGVIAGPKFPGAPRHYLPGVRLADQGSTASDGLMELLRHEDLGSDRFLDALLITLERDGLTLNQRHLVAGAAHLALGVTPIIGGAGGVSVWCDLPAGRA